MAKYCCYLKVFLVVILTVCTGPALSTPLKEHFYKKTRPLAESIVRSTVKKARKSDDGIAAALIRLHFHDCFVRGCEGSILLDSTPGNKAEKDSHANLGIDGFEVIDEAKAKLEAQCPNTVSCADIVAYAARDSVYFSGGLHYEVLAGRRDGVVSSADEAAKNLPGSFFDVKKLKENFERKGLSLEEMVTLSGAHSIGESHCSSFSKRLYNFNATHPQDPSMDPAYANYLKTKCTPRRPLNTNNNSADPNVSFDPETPILLDNNYYKKLKSKKGLLFSDQVLYDTALTKSMVKKNIDRPRVWAKKFVAAMLHMGSIEVLTGSQGQIRKSCRVVN